MANQSPPLLALPSGSILQFTLMFLPLLILYLYFLYLVIERPSKADPDKEEYFEDRIRLTDILYCYLVTLVAFSSLVAYLIWFVRKRRKLSRSYETEGITILGDVEYDDGYGDVNGGFLAMFLRFVKNGCRRNDYGFVVYDLEKVANHPACDYYDKHVEKQKAGKRGKQSKPLGKIRKNVRVYHHYPRESVSILVLPKYPYSGQPKIDLEADWASFAERNGIPSEFDDESYNDYDQVGDANPRINLPKTLSRDRSLGVLIISAFWISFCFFGALYICFQIEVIEEYYPDESAGWAWGVFWITCGGIVPIVAGLGNYLRWKRYEWWILKSGKVLNSGGSNDADGMKADEGNYVQMT